MDSGGSYSHCAFAHLSHVRLTVQAASLDTGNGTRDAVLRSDDFFDVAKYPTLYFANETITPKSPRDGNLTIQGVTKRITLPAQINGTSIVPGVWRVGWL
jgi:polyisoprenoid-binding protein YceI